MQPHNRSDRVQVLPARTEGISHVPEHLIAVIGCALIARPLFERMHYGDEVIWCGALAGALMVVISLTTAVRLTLWQPWLQAAAGYGLWFTPLFLSSGTPDWTTLAAGVVLVTLATVEIAAIESARDHDRRRGWRWPTSRTASHLRLVYSPTQRRSSENSRSLSLKVVPGYKGMKPTFLPMKFLSLRSRLPLLTASRSDDYGLSALSQGRCSCMPLSRIDRASSVAGPRARVAWTRTNSTVPRSGRP
jgi:hypothetical protein